jgi:aerobic carbon-monoxide dehydrogenase medium subunit
MKPAQFDYAAPQSLEEALSLLAANEGAKIISGGQSLMPLLAFRLAAPTLLVDLRKVPGLSDIEVGPEGVRLGARVRWVDIEKDERLRTAHPLLASAIDHVAHYQIRNRGTVGGSMSHADPAAEMPGVAITCDATIEIAAPGGRREVPAAEFFQGSLQTVLDENEIMTAVHLPAWNSARRWAFTEFSRRAGDFALAAVLLFYDRDEQGRVRDAHVGAIGVGDCPRRVGEVEAALNGAVIDDAAIERASRAAFSAIEPSSDQHADADYRRSLYCTLLEQSLRRSCTSAKDI